MAVKSKRWFHQDSYEQLRQCFRDFVSACILVAIAETVTMFVRVNISKDSPDVHIRLGCILMTAGQIA
jgi:hypothetical protein